MNNTKNPKVLRQTIKIQMRMLKAHLPKTVTKTTIFKPPVKKFSTFNPFVNNIYNNNTIFNTNQKTNVLKSYNSSLKFSQEGIFLNKFLSKNNFSTDNTNINNTSNDLFSTLDIKAILENLEVNTSSNIDLTNNTDNDNSDFSLEENFIEYQESMNFEELVVKSPYPVVVDCYAEWCGPCKKLYPIIKEKYDTMKNFRFVKINIDENDQLAEQLNISSIPAVFLIYKGNMVDQFLGLPNETRLNEFFQGVNLLKGLGNNEGILSGLLIGADEFFMKKDYEKAENMLKEAYSHEEMMKKFGHVIRYGLAMISFVSKDYKKSSGFINDIKQFNANELNNDGLTAKKVSLLEIHIEVVEGNKDLGDISNKSLQEIETNSNNSPSDLNLKFLLANKHLQEFNYEKAIDSLLDIIKVDRNWENKKAHSLLLKIFSAQGSTNKLVIEGRKKLANILY